MNKLLWGLKVIGAELLVWLVIVPLFIPPVIDYFVRWLVKPLRREYETDM